MSFNLEDYVSNAFLNCNCGECRKHKDIIQSILDGKATPDMFVVTVSENYVSSDRELMAKDRIKAALMPKRAAK